MMKKEEEEYLDIKPKCKKIKLDPDDKSADCQDCGADTQQTKHCYLTLNHTCNGLFCFLSHEDIEKALQDGVFDPEGLSKRTRLVYFDPDLMMMVVLVGGGMVKMSCERYCGNNYQSSVCWSLHWARETE